MAVKCVFVFFIGILMHCFEWGNNKDIPIPTGYNDRPIIGILSQDLPPSLSKRYPYAVSYIAASYVKYIESAGARVVPILVEKNDDYYEKLFNSINGVLLPGGSANISNSTYEQAAKKLYSLAVKANDEGDYFPIWGTCLGFEMLSILMDKNQRYWLTSCKSSNVALPLTMSREFLESKLFKDVPEDVFAWLTMKNVTANFHQKCLTKENATKSGLDKTLHILSVNHDQEGLEFISTFEAFSYPFYGVQWHPEKNVYEWTRNEMSIPHNYEAIRVAQYFANFFINEARKSKHVFEDDKIEREALIYRFRPVYTGYHNSSFEECYFFKSSDDGRF